VSNSFGWRWPWLTLKRGGRGLRLLARYGSTRKFANAARAELAFRRRDVIVDSLPYLFRAEPTTSCSVRCPYCSSALYGRQPPAQLSLDDFVRGFAPFREYCLLTSYHMSGEPTLNPALPDMVRYGHEAGSATYVSTNLQQVEEAYLERLLLSGLDLLTISVDAASPETYAVMKPGGDFDRLLANLDAVFRLKRRVPHPPAIGFQTLVTRKNEAELQRISALAGRYGADYVDFKCTWLQGMPTWEPANPRYRFARLLRPRVRCFMPWASLTLAANGRFFPCCAPPVNFDLGPICGDPRRDVWNGEAMRRVREDLHADAPAGFCRDCVVGRIPRF
jgi:MoaA/NifB/PqqE/SkfB family radical SAM enzyme